MASNPINKCNGKMQRGKKSGKFRSKYALSKDNLSACNFCIFSFAYTKSWIVDMDNWVQHFFFICVCYLCMLEGKRRKPILFMFSRFFSFVVFLFFLCFCFRLFSFFSFFSLLVFLFLLFGQWFFAFFFFCCLANELNVLLLISNPMKRK